MTTQGALFLETKIVASPEGSCENTIETIDSFVRLTHLGHILTLPYLFSSLKCAISSSLGGKKNESFIPNRILRNKKKHVPRMYELLVAAVTSFH